MTDNLHKPDIEQQLESIENRIRQGHSVGELGDPELQRAADALLLINRIKAQQGLETAAGFDTRAGGELATGLPDSSGHIGRFEIREKLGQGGFGVVFRAFDPDLQRDVALKIPRPHAFATRDLRERFLREGRAAAALAHPNIIPVFESGTVGPICYTASQFVPGQSLAAYIEQNKLTILQAAGIVKYLAEAAEHAHQRGVVHRDIKPGNVMVRDDNSLPIEKRVQLTDFGLARNLSDDSRQTREGDLVGTPAYMPPEQIAGSADAGPACDVYALGALLYELVAGQPPFAGETVLDVLNQVRNQEAMAPSRINPRVPADLDAVCLKCLEKDPARRYSAAFCLAEDLGRFLRREPVQARRIGPMMRFARWYRRNRIVATVASLAFLFLALGLAGTLWMYGQSQSSLALAQQQTSLAGRGLERTRRSVDRLLTDVSQALADRPGMDKLRQRLLTDAREIYQEVLNDDYLQQVDAANALDSFYRIAIIENQLGNLEQCQLILQQGLDEYEKLTAARKQQPEVLVSWSRLARMDCMIQIATGHPARQGIPAIIEKLESVESPDVELQESLTELFRQAGIDNLQQGRVSEGIKYLESAVAVLDSVESAAHSREVMFMRAQTLNSLGIARKSNGEYDKAIGRYEEVVAILSVLLDEFPERARYQEMQAIVACNLGNLHFNAGNLNDARDSYELAMERCRMLRTLFPDRNVFLDVFARAASGFGLVSRKLDDFDAAREAYDESINAWREFGTRFGESRGAGEGLQIALGGMATLLKTRELWDEARPLELESIRLKRQQVEQFPDRPGSKKSLSLQLGNLAVTEFAAGNRTAALEHYEEALQIAIDLYAAHPDYPGQLANINYQFTGVACTLAALDRHQESGLVIERQAAFLPDNSDQIQRTIETLGSIAKLIRDSDDLDLETKTDLVADYSRQANSLMALAGRLGADVSTWLDAEPANALNPE